jgi:hypothetical protein
VALVRSTSTTVELPHELGNFATICRVRRAVLDAASDVRQERAIQKVQRLGGVKAIAEFRDAAAQATQETDVAPTRPADAYDEQTLLEAGLVSMSGPLYDAVGGTIDAAFVADLDRETARFLAEQIADFSLNGARAKNV